MGVVAADGAANVVFVVAVVVVVVCVCGGEE